MKINKPITFVQWKTVDVPSTDIDKLILKLQDLRNILEFERSWDVTTINNKYYDLDLYTNNSIKKSYYDMQ